MKDEGTGILSLEVRADALAGTEYVMSRKQGDSRAKRRAVTDLVSAGVLPNSFGKVAVPGQSDVDADATADTLNLAGSTNIGITTNATTDTVTFKSIFSATARLLGRFSGGGGDAEEVSLASRLAISGGALDIVDGQVSTAKLADGSVTLAKLATIATNTLLGRFTASTGAVESVPLSARLAMISSALDVAANGITYAKFQQFTGQYKLLGRASAAAGNAEEIASSADVFAVLASADDAAIRNNIEVPYRGAGSNAVNAFWTGTQAAYDLLTPNSATVYYIVG